MLGVAIGALLLAIVLTPTDASLGQAVVSNPKVPVRIQHAEGETLLLVNQTIPGSIAKNIETLGEFVFSPDNGADITVTLHPQALFFNNAGVMPLAFYADHAEAADAWERCIDINFKGVLNGIMAVHDQMISQGRGHVVNLSSIYGNYPVAGAGVYGATKAFVQSMSEAIRQELKGTGVKVCTLNPPYTTL